ncbi:AMP-binding protein [Xenorhabdus siamensis]|uniref:AMP-binding protein n=1 Tax=Xenorhabdus siamensis TaxID=3136254 RepID=UPI0030F3FF5F
MCHVHRQWWWGLLAVLKAGGAYVPLDPAYPGERLAHILTIRACYCAGGYRRTSQYWVKRIGRTKRA